MSQIEQHNRDRVLEPLIAWITAPKMEDLRPNEIIKDDCIPFLLRELKQPTFVTINVGFWNKNLVDPNYCILYFSLQDNQQAQTSKLLRQFLHQKEFKTKAIHKGKIAKVGTTGIDYWQWNSQ